MAGLSFSSPVVYNEGKSWPYGVLGGHLMCAEQYCQSAETGLRPCHSAGALTWMYNLLFSKR